MPEKIGTYVSPYKKALDKIKSRAGDNAVLKEIAKEEDPKARQLRETNSEVVHKITSKCLSNYRNGEYSWPETVDMICSALKKVK